jgi:hypothetical protein
MSMMLILLGGLVVAIIAIGGAIVAWKEQRDNEDSK